MRRLFASVLAVAGAAASIAIAGPAQADPGQCQFLGQNYNVQYPCDQYQPWLPWGTGNNPPLGGSAVTPGGDGPSGGYHWSPSCRACSS